MKPIAFVGAPLVCALVGVSLIACSEDSGTGVPGSGGQNASGGSPSSGGKATSGGTGGSNPNGGRAGNTGGSGGTNRGGSGGTATGGGPSSLGGNGGQAGASGGTGSGGASGAGFGGSGGATGGDYNCKDYIFPKEDITSIVSGYDPSRWYDAALQALDRRYPSGSWIVRNADSPEQTFGKFLSSKSTFNQMVSSMGFAIHEVNHTLTDRAGREKFQYMIGKDKSGKEDITIITQVKTFPRKEVRPLVPADMASLTYVSTYLEGGSGDMDIESTLDEFNSYTHQLYGDYAFIDGQSMNSRHSSRDGMVSFMLFLELYLNVGRTQHPDDYAAMKTSPELKPLILKIWDRAWCLLEATKDDTRLGMEDGKVTPHVLEEKWLSEIKLFRN